MKIVSKNICVCLSFNKKWTKFSSILTQSKRGHSHVRPSPHKMNQAKNYSRNNVLQRTDATYVLDNYLRLMKWKKTKTEKIADVGAGDGSVSLELLLPRIPVEIGKFVGCDVSEEMVKYAKTQSCDGKIDFVQMNVEAPSIPIKLHNEFDHVFSFYCLHWIQDQRQAFKNIYDLLVPGGDALLVFLASNPVFHIYEAMGQSKRWGPYMQDYRKYISPYHFFDDPVEQAERYLEEAGFCIHLCRLENRNFTWLNVETMQKSTKSVNPFIQRIPEGEVDDYVQDFEKEVRKLSCVKIFKCNNNNEDRIYFTYQLFVVFVSKPDKSKSF